MADVRFTNGHGSRIYVAYMMFDTACGADCGDPWTVRGWINLDPGQTKTRPTNNRFCYYYAEDDNGATWGGNFSAEVKQERFEKCTCLGVSVSHGQNPWHSVGMDELDLNQFGGVGFNG
jgi:uncharacterized membrane protein